MDSRYKFNRMEFAGSLGDLGTLLPLAIGMILVNGLDPIGVFFTIGLYFVVSGLYFGVTVPVQPMKVIGAYAVATAISSSQIYASSALMAIVLLLLGATGVINRIGRYIPKSVVRGVQLSTGLLLLAEGVRFMIGASKFQTLLQSAEPYLVLQNLGPVPLGIVIGTIGCILTLLFLDNKKIPAGLIIIIGGAFIGLVLGNHESLNFLKPKINLPSIIPFKFPSQTDFTFALFALVLPQIPMTVGNAVMAYTDLSKEYFGEASKKITYRSSCLSMAFANITSFILGGIPLCHGAGGLAAHYRFGARTAGSNLIIGSIFLIMTLLLGNNILSAVNLIPMSVLGVLLVFAGSQLSLTIIDVKERKDLFVVLIIPGITLASNLATAFIVGIFISLILKSEKLSV